MEGLEKEQSSEGVLGAQPSDTATSNEETPSPDTTQFTEDTGAAGGDTGASGSNATTGTTSGDKTVTGGKTGDAAGSDVSGAAPVESDFPDQ